MLIKSQNEKIIVNMNNVAAIELIDTIKDENGNEIPSENLFAIGVSTTNGRDFVMATFKVRDDAQKVIDSIIEKYAAYRTSKTEGLIVEAPKVYKIPKED